MKMYFLNMEVMMVMVVMVMVIGDTRATLDPPPHVIPGDTVIGIVCNLHDGDGDGGCSGALRPRMVEQVMAAQWALETINNQSLHDFNIGLRVYDACGDESRALKQTIKLWADTMAPQPPLLGVVALGSSQLVSSISLALHTLQTPILITDAITAHTTKPQNNLFTTAPHITDQIRAVLTAADRLGGEDDEGVSVISSLDHASDLLEEQGVRGRTKVVRLLRVKDDHNLTEKIINFANTNVSVGGVVVLLLRSAELATFTIEVEEGVLRRSGVRWVLSTLGGETLPKDLVQNEIRNKFSGSLLVESHSTVTSLFSRYFADAVFNKTSVMTPLTHHYLDTIAHCDPPPLQGLGASVPPCVSADDVAQLVEGSPVTSTVSAVSSLAAAFRRVQIKKCSRTVHCPEVLSEDLHNDVLQELLLQPYLDGPDKIQYIANRLNNFFSIVHITSHQLHEIGTYREDIGMEWSAVEEMMNLSKGKKHEKRGKSMSLVAEEKTKHKSVTKASLNTHDDYVRRTWAFSVLVTACLGVVASLYITIYVGLRVCDGTLRGPQVLGIILLLGLMGVFASCVVYVLPPSAITCSIRQWAPNLCLTLCYGVLLVKSMQLRALVSVGTEGEVSQVNLHLTLLFILGVQVSLCMLGHAGGMNVGEDPLVKVEPSGGRLCGIKYLATLSTRLYLLCLLIICLILSAFNRKIQRNHNEGHWLLLTSCVSVPVVVVWSVMSYLAPPSLEAPTTSVALLILASLIIGLIFIPKMRIIAQEANKFRHKRMAAAAASVSTILSQLEDRTAAGLTSPLQQEGMKQLYANTQLTSSPRHSHRDSLGSVRSSIISHNNYRAAFSAVYGLPQPSPTHTTLRNPIHEASNGTFP